MTQLIKKKIRVRAFLLLIPIVTMIGLTLMAALKVLSTEQTTRLQLYESYELSRAAMDLKFRTADFNGWQTAYAFDIVRGASRATEDTGSSRKLFLQSAEVFREQLEKVERLSLTSFERLNLNNTKSYFQEFMNLDAKVIAFYRSGKELERHRANELIIGREIELFQSITKSIQSLENSVSARTDAAIRKANGAMRSTRLYLFITGGIAFLLIGVLTTATIRFMSDKLKLVEQFHSMAHTDVLTGIDNRRSLDDQLPGELEQSRRLGYPICFVLIDIDYFKKFNDELGHQAGDNLLSALAQSFHSLLRNIDVFARYGGEEFALLLPGCDVHQACGMIERLRGVMPLNQTFSAGVSCWDGVESSETLVKRTDIALYKAKEQGRNRTVVSDKVHHHEALEVV